MPIITVTGAHFTHSKDVVKQLSSHLNLSVVTDEQLMDMTAASFDINKDTIEKVYHSKQIPFNDLTHEKEKILAGLKKTVADHVVKGNVIFNGVMGHLIPTWITHALRILIVTDKETRIKTGEENFNLPLDGAREVVNEADKLAILWVNGLTGKKAWDDSLYDIVAPSDKLDVNQTVELIAEHYKNLTAMPVDRIEREAANLALAADVELALATTGSGLSVFADDGKITVTIDRNVLLLNKFKQKITGIAEKIDGVTSVDTRIGKKYYKSGTTHGFDFETPLHVLLVDDEKEFVQTLSQRLQMRQINSDVVYSGEDALDTANREDGAEVMVLDLKMPGIDGFEVLEKIKKSKPGIEVIILTGHGTDKDKARCMELGAFAYLQKPADIDLLAETMKKAYEKISQKKQQAE